jgi:hypothetical protein
MYSVKRYIFEKVKESTLIKESQNTYIDFIKQIEDLYYNNNYDEIEEILKQKVYVELNKVNESNFCYIPKEYSSNGLEEIICNIVKTQFSKKDQYIFFQHVYEQRSLADIANDLNISRQQVSSLYGRQVEYFKYVIKQINKNKNFLSYKQFRISKSSINRKKRELSL